MDREKYLTWQKKGGEQYVYHDSTCGREKGGGYISA